jgi:hypothetical protein
MDANYNMAFSECNTAFSEYNTAVCRVYGGVKLVKADKNTWDIGEMPVIT